MYVKKFCKCFFIGSIMANPPNVMLLHLKAPTMHLMLPDLKQVKCCTCSPPPMSYIYTSHFLSCKPFPSSPSIILFSLVFL